jgi:hypothetical protein
MSRDDHRVYSHLCEPLRIMGCTVDEILLFLFGMVFFFVANSLEIKCAAFLFSFGALFFLKRLKKVVHGFNIKAFLHWHFGFRFGADQEWPDSCYRRWLP